MCFLLGHNKGCHLTAVVWLLAWDGEEKRRQPAGSELLLLCRRMEVPFLKFQKAVQLVLQGWVCIEEIHPFGQVQIMTHQVKGSPPDACCPVQSTLSFLHSLAGNKTRRLMSSSSRRRHKAFSTVTHQLCGLPKAAQSGEEEGWARFTSNPWGGCARVEKGVVSHTKWGRKEGKGTEQKAWCSNQQV